MEKTIIASAIAEVVKFLNSIRMPCRGDYCECFHKFFEQRDYYKEEYEKLKRRLGVETYMYIFGIVCFNLVAYEEGNLWVSDTKAARLVEDIVYEDGVVMMKADIKEVYDEEVKKELCKIMPNLTACQS